MIKFLMLLLWACLLMPTISNAQSPVGITFLNVNGGRSVVGINDPLPTGAGFKISSFGTPINVTISNSTGTLPTGVPIVLATNVGANAAYCALGATATTSSQYIPSGGSFPFIIVGATQLTCITGSSTTIINMTGGSGNAGSSGGGGSGGGGGGAITMASGAVASGAYAAGSFAAGAGVDGWDLGIGISTSVAATVGGAGNVAAKLRLMTTQLDTINTNVQAGAATTGAGVPGSAIYMGINVGGNLIGWNGAVTNAGTFVVQNTNAAETTKVLGTIRTTGNVGGVLDAVIGAAPPANSYQLAALGGGATGGFIARVISCDNHVFKHITTATDTLAVQGVASQTIYICAWRSRAAGTATWYLENTNNANANCGGTLTQITGLASEIVNSGEVFAPGYWNGLKNTSGNGLCINSTGTGGVDIDIWYVQF